MSDNPKNPWDDGKEEDIWSKKRRQKNSPTPDDLVQELQDKLKQTFKFKGGSGGPGGLKPLKGIFTLVLLAFVGLWAYSCYYKVEPNQVGVVLRFGEVVRTTSEGPHLHFRPIEQVFVVNVTTVNRIDGSPLKENQRGNNEKTLILTGDQNLIHTYYTIQWRISNVKSFLFTARDPEKTIKAAAESSLREVVGQMNAQGILTTERDIAGNKIETLLQEILDKYGIGVKIVRFQLTKSEAPAEVIQSFNELQSSKNDAEREVNEGQGYAGDIVPRARGQAERVLQQAQAYLDKTVSIARGEAERLRKVRLAYSKNPSAAKKRQYYSMMERVLDKNKILLVDESMGQGAVPYLSLNELTRKNKQ
jgi:membrane protease subunit HflK